MSNYAEERMVRFQSTRTARVFGRTATEWRKVETTMKRASAVATAFASYAAYKAVQTIMLPPVSEAYGMYAVAAGGTAAAAAVAAEVAAAAALEAERLNQARNAAARRAANEKAKREAEQKRINEAIENTHEQFERHIRSERFHREYRDPPSVERLERIGRIA